ncbi:MAG: FHA domain-containing protein [Isosphaeraceae bacterium]
MRVILEVVVGPLRGRQFVLDRHDSFIFGRSRFVHCPMPEDFALSRDHFLIEINESHCDLRDLGSTNGTYVNNSKVERVRLLKQDLIAAGQSVFRVNIELTQTQVDSEADDVLVDRRYSNPIGVFREETSGTDSLLEECNRIRALLELNHVKWDHAERHGLINEVLKAEAYIRNILGAGFYRLVVLDATCGLDAGGVFDECRFLEAVRADIVKAFGLELVGGSFHIADIFQVLKDERTSLFCFVNFQLIPFEHLRTIRSFTQGVHRVLLLTQGYRDIAR